MKVAPARPSASCNSGPGASAILRGFAQWPRHGESHKNGNARWGGRFLDDVTLGEVTYRQGRGLESSSGRELVRDLAVTRVVQSAVVDRCSRVAGGAVRHHAHSENPRRYRITEAVLLVSITGVPALITRACTVSSRLTREAIPMPAGRRGGNQGHDHDLQMGHAIRTVD